MTKKRPRYDDQFRASAVLMLQSQGWPNVPGVSGAVARKLGIKRRTLERWAKNESNPPPDNVVQHKRQDILEEIERLQFALLGEMWEAFKEAPLNHIATTFGILTDKSQLLSGKPTDRTEVIDNSYKDRLISRLGTEQRPGRGTGRSQRPN